jgi:O-antigen/teichoic acid export membrane protein
VAIGFVLALGLGRAAARQGLARPIDWRWIKASGTSSPIVFASELGATGLLYSDRYIVALLLGDRAAGAFTFIWSIINAVVPIVQGGVFNQMMPQLASQWHRRQWHGWLASFEAAMSHATWMSIGFGVTAMLTALVLLRTAHLALSIDHAAFAGLMTIATVVRMRADVLHHALYSAEQDSDWIAVNILGLVLGPVMALIGIGLFGFIGAGAQMVLVALALYTMRLRLVRRAMAQAQLAGREQEGVLLF